MIAAEIVSPELFAPFVVVPAETFKYDEPEISVPPVPLDKTIEEVEPTFLEPKTILPASTSIKQQFVAFEITLATSSIVEQAEKSRFDNELSTPSTVIFKEPEVTALIYVKLDVKTGVANVAFVADTAFCIGITTKYPRPVLRFAF